MLDYGSCDAMRFLCKQMPNCEYENHFRFKQGKTKRRKEKKRGEETEIGIIFVCHDINR